MGYRIGCAHENSAVLVLAQHCFITTIEIEKIITDRIN